MSHFSVLVKITNEQWEKHKRNLESAVGEMMAPYQENNMDDCPRQYLEFNDEEDSMHNEYTAEGVERVFMPDGRKLLTWDNEFRKPGAIGVGSDTHHVPEDLPRFEVLFRVTYKTFEDFAKDWHGKESRDGQTGRYGYWENPNAKWDYWRIGGRWRGSLRVNECATSATNGPKAWELGGPSSFVTLKEVPDQPHTADICCVEDLDLEGMIATEKPPWAVLDNTGWHEANEMGWWGMSAKTKEEDKKWKSEYAERFLRHEKPDTLLVICDCHI